MVKSKFQPAILLIFMLLLSHYVKSAPIQEYKVFAVNDLGMHCVDDDFSTFTILPPFNVVQAQVIGIDTQGRPSVLSPANGVELTYAPTADRLGSINSSWKDKYGNPKTNFWSYQQAYGLKLADGVGIFGLTMPKDAKTRAEKSFSWVNEARVFKAPGIPILPIDDNGNKNFYPLLKIQASNSTTHKALAGASTRIVLPVSDETTCKNCHATNASAADPVKYPKIAWSINPDPSVQYRENVLKLHDAKFTTALEAAKPVLCASCHYSPALDLTGSGPSEVQKLHKTMSAVMHDNHANKMVLNGVRLPDKPVLVGGKVPNPAKQSCYQCHPGSETRCLRGAMTENVTCQNCHGNMQATGGHYPLKTGGSLDGKNDGGKRRPWVDLPRCQSCHTGDETNHLPVTASTSEDGLREHFAFDIVDRSASPRLATNKRFAEQANTLYRFSKGHGGVLCENCHNSTHAIWPGDAKHPNDNVAAIKAQGHTGTIMECTTCHKNGSLALTLNGPHGMHNVNDKEWANGGHGDFYEHNAKSCQSCHGLDLKGSPLAKAAANRVFVTEFGTKNYTAGQKVTCFDCHNGPDFDD
ncbi:MAG: carboxypeptidase regulatory-like domain-containing protein [Methylovulum miyakonense]|uniref:carboxypeptidase regulatory-like domain-containing protein n=1 Tax=Methylovulum miyakonense TaxID=645578 RepID=UPI003BB5DE2D